MLKVDTQLHPAAVSGIGSYASPVVDSFVCAVMGSAQMKPRVEIGAFGIAVCIATDSRGSALVVMSELPTNEWQSPASAARSIAEVVLQRNVQLAPSISSTNIRWFVKHDAKITEYLDLLVAASRICRAPPRTQPCPRAVQESSQMMLAEMAIRTLSEKAIALHGSDGFLRH